jgi:hypothetical protein
MRRSRILAVLLSFLAVTGFAVAPSVSAQTVAASTWNLGSASTGSQGGLLWLNRSVTVQGSVWDYGNGYSDVYFLPFHGTTALYDRAQTRSVTEGERSLNFPLDGSDLVGGIGRVYIRTCWYPTTGGAACEVTSLYR